MRAAVLQDIRDIRILDIPEPRPVAEDDLIVRVKAVGVCGSDLHSYLEGGTTGPTRVRPFVLGHEFSGVLTPDSARKAGLSADALVAVDPSIPCDHCEWCRRGQTNLCPNVKFLGYAPHNGAMAEFVCVPRSAVHVVPDSIDPAGAAILETLGVAIHAMDLARPRLLETVAVLGCGPVGLLLVQLARLAGSGKIIAIDPVEQRTALACDLGADGACRSYAGVGDLTEGRGVDLVIEATDSSHGFEHAARCARIGGRVVLVGIPENNQYILSGAESRRKGLSIKFSRRMPEVYPRAIALAQGGQVKLTPLATHRFSLDQTPAAFEQQVARRDGIIKAIISP
ncbi:alcohol dehydrogenase catalytic domain-containing protein [Bradyrhizobium manausense]|uniref:zinc-dependent alcohol dehydrogenase n=1 Tax=Bradyrhizobium TaxID=374 RepID=UPI001BA858D9|nr:MULTISPECIES: alcohol dehydrogenase catalytic domain-containing protein [Bradyrhizobium]MBR0830247.1 alcohol dehydrogenase catalytic domain-containing protein [Bradyrhizobium manausense]UVO31553.1 alcohol dehydrogenase catalytic domain-containing protein [Bradyrhizobium arachidis]